MYHRPPTNRSNSNRDRNATDSAPPAQDDIRKLLEGLTENSTLLARILEQSKGDTAEIKEILKNEAKAEFVVQRRSPHAAAGC
jgi:hypothetical protein